MTVELSDITLTHLTRITVHERADIVHHRVPGMPGDLAQVLGRPSVAVHFQGIFYGPEAVQSLGELRAAYLANQPVDFFTEAVGEGYFTQVLITRLDVSQRVGYPDQLDFACNVVEYVEPPEPAAAVGLETLDTELVGEAMAFVDDVQNALAEVSGLVDLIANVPSFGDPTTRLPAMFDQYSAITSGGLTTLTNILDLF